jgi:hypothetical protein
MQKFPDKPYLRTPHGPADAAKRVELIQRAVAEKQKIQAYFEDVAHWNRVRQPHEAEIDPDPDGQMAELLRYLNTLISSAVD